MSKFFNDKDVPRLRMGQDLVTKCASTWTGSLSSLRLSCVVSWSSRLLLACHVTAAKMLPPLSGMFLCRGVYIDVYRVAQTSPPHAHLTPGL